MCRCSLSCQVTIVPRDPPPQTMCRFRNILALSRRCRGDYVFVAGQMPNNEAMTGLAPEAYRAPNAVWNGTDIRLQTEFLIKSRLKPGLEAGGSSLKNAIKAQVYLTDINDLPEFMDVWNSHFRRHRAL